MPFPRRLTPLPANKMTRHLTDHLIRREYRDGIEIDFMSNTFYTKVANQPARERDFLSMFTYAGTNQGYYRNSTGLLIPSINGSPRIEWDSNRNRLGLLEESTKANLLLRSHDFSNASWTKSGCTVPAQARTGPDGVIVVGQHGLVENSGGTFHFTRQDVAGLAANVRYTLSCLVKPQGRNFCRFQLSNVAETDGAQADINLTTGTGSVAAFGAGSAQTLFIEPFIDGWWRIELTCIVDAASTTLRSQILIASALGTINYSGDGTSGIDLWGGQLELGGFGTSIITTGAAPITRTDETFVHLLNSAYLQTGGTLAVEYRTKNRLTSTFATAMSIDDNSTNNRIFLFRNNVGTRTAGAVAGGVSQFSSAGGDDGSTMRKQVVVYSSAEYRNFFNGALIGSVGAASVPTVDRLRLGNSAYGADFLNGHVRRVRYYPRLFTDVEAIAESII